MIQHKSETLNLRQGLSFWETVIRDESERLGITFIGRAASKTESHSVILRGNQLTPQ